MPVPRQEIIDNPIPTSLFMCYVAVMLFVGIILRCNLKTNRNTCKCVKEKQICRDGVINDVT